MKDFLTTFLKTGVPFGLVMGLFSWFISGGSSGIVSGFISGSFFGLAMATFASYQARRVAKNPPVFDEDEVRVLDAAANHFVNGVAFGGWMYLTDKQLLFVGHGANLRSHELSIPLHHVVGSRTSRSLGLIPNRLDLLLSDGTEEKFVVTKPRSWADEVERLRQAYLNEPRSDDAKLFADANDRVHPQ